MVPEIDSPRRQNRPSAPRHWALMSRLIDVGPHPWVLGIGVQRGSVDLHHVCNNDTCVLTARRNLANAFDLLRVVLCGRPLRRPRGRAGSRPARVRPLRVPRSSCAKACVVVSMAFSMGPTVLMPSDKERNVAPLRVAGQRPRRRDRPAQGHAGAALYQDGRRDARALLRDRVQLHSYNGSCTGVGRGLQRRVGGTRRK